MEAIWYAIVSIMLATYVVLDGFDFGVGILHLIVARTDKERRTIFAAIGPLWDGNEVWLIAAGGVLVYAFPRAYAAGFSGFYLALMMVLWLLILRGLSIEFRSKEQNPLWRAFWDGAFFFSSTLMAIVLGAALGNVIRGVPVDATGYFSGPLFTNFMVGPHPGVLDWYTVLVGMFTLLALAGHGATYLCYKTSDAVHDRAGALAPKIWGAVLVVGALTTLATARVRPELFEHLLARPWTWALVLMILVSVVTLFTGLSRKKDGMAFAGSAGFLLFMLASTAAGGYPNILISTLNRDWDIHAHNAMAGTLSLQVGLIWWLIAMALALGYFIYLFRSFRGKVDMDTDDHAY